MAEFTSAVELIKDDKGQAAGAVLLNMETGEYLTCQGKNRYHCHRRRGKAALSGLSHLQSLRSHTADGLILGYRAGVPLLYQDTIQYHPTGAAYPAQIFGALVTEKVRSLGAMLVNVEGEAFIHPLETRDVAAAGIIRECRSRNKGVPVPEGYGVMAGIRPWIELIHGEGTIEKRIPAMLRMFLNYGIDMRKMPILVYPTLHYQNGGLKLTARDTPKPSAICWFAGEAVGGIHGRNRLMGNSLLDIIVFGRNAGKAAARKAKDVTLGNPTLRPLEEYARELEEAGLHTGCVSPCCCLTMRESGICKGGIDFERN